MLSIESGEMNAFLTTWQLNFYFLFDFLKYHTELNNFC